MTGKKVRSRSATVADVAALAGVSTATVSRALATPDLVRPETEERVRAAARQVGFTPNSSARSLRRQRTDMVLVVMSTIANQQYSETLKGIDAALAARDYGFIVGSLEGMPGKEGRFIEFALSRQVDGIILVSGIIPRSRGRTLAESGLPMVAVLAPVVDPSIPTVVVDDPAIAREAARYLSGLGHKRLGFVAGPPGDIVDTARWSAFREEAGRLGIASHDVARYEGDPTYRFAFPSGLVAAQAFLSRDPRPTAVFCSSDEMALGFLKTIRGAGLRVPQDVSVLGVDGIAMSDLTDPALSTFRQPRYDIGRTGGEILMRLLDGRGPPAERLTLMPVELLRRGTTGPPGRSA